MRKLYTLGLFLFAQSLFAKDFKGAELYSKNTVLYGKFEMCMRTSKVGGMLSTFFLYKDGSEQPGTFWEEIDIEVFGKENGQSFQSNIITGTGNQTHSEEVHAYPFSLADGFHIYGLEWTPNYVAWYFDGVLVRKSEGGQVNDLKSPMSYRFNTWASSSVPWVGNFESSKLPTQQFVDWLSYSEYTPGTGTDGSDFTYSWKDEFTTVSPTRWAKATWTFDGNLVDFAVANAQTLSGKLILSATTASQTGFSGAVPTDNCDNILDIKSSSVENNLYSLSYQDEKGSFLFEPKSPDALISVRNLEGRLVLEQRGKSSFGTELKSGIYVCTVRIGDKAYTKKVLKY